MSEKVEIDLNDAVMILTDAIKSGNAVDFGRYNRLSDSIFRSASSHITEPVIQKTDNVGIGVTSIDCQHPKQSNLLNIEPLRDRFFPYDPKWDDLLREILVAYHKKLNEVINVLNSR